MPALDTLYPFEAPEGVELTLRPAGPVARGLAFAIDAALRLVLLAAAALLLNLLGELGTGLMLLLLFFLEWLYPVAFEVTLGATPGKRALRLMVLHDDGTPVGWSAALVRNLLRVVDFLPLLYAAGLVSMLFQRRFQRLGDLAAGTLVVYAPPRAPVAADVAGVAPRPAPLALSAIERQALIDFAERRTALAPARVAELAGLLEPGPDAVERVLSHAAWAAEGR